MKITLCPKELFRKNLYLIFVLLCANILGIISTFYLGHDYAYGLIPLFNFDTEKNIPTFYSSIALILVSALLSYIAFACKKMKMSYIPWLGLSIIFLFLSIDEIASIHERLLRPVRETFGTSGLLYFAWVIPYGIFLVALIIAYSKFLLELPRNIMILFLISGATFVSGAIGFELLGGRHAELYGINTLHFSILTTCEELLEMIGIAIFIYTLLMYIANEYESINITVAKQTS